MTPDPNISLAKTPNIERLLRSLRGRLVRLTILYGFGTVLGIVAGWLVVAYLADWGLRVPRAIRIFHGLVLLGLFGAFVWRDLVRPMRRIPGRPGLALLFERAHPELRELLISAVEFQNPRAGKPDGDPALVDRVLAEAEESAAALESKGIVDVEIPRARFLLGTLGGVFVLGFALWQPTHAGIFLDRLIGGSSAWPQRTHLTIEVPGLDQMARIEETDERLRLRIARGTDVPIVVRAEGVIPDSVRLHFDGGRDLMLTRSGPDVFRTLLRSCQEDVSFHATGGDDDDGLPSVEVEVLQPPDVEGVTVAVRPPAYSGLPERIVRDRDVDVLAGSELRIHVLPSPADAIGVARLLPMDEVIELRPGTYPQELLEGEGESETETPGLLFDHVATRSVGFRLELEDATGLTNPDPGLFRIQVREDRAPELQVLAPARSDLEIVAGGAVALRARVADDIGIRSMGWRISSGTSTDDLTLVASGELELEPVVSDDEASGRVAVSSTRIEVSDLGTAEIPVAVDQRYILEFVALDNREPEANEGKSLPVRARVVTPEELLRRMQERLARARLDALQLSELQMEKRQRVEDLVDVFDGDGPSEGGEGVALAAALSGQRRVVGDAQALARDLASIAQDILYARLDEKAGALLNRYDELSSSATELRFSTAPWRTLALESESGDLGASGFALNLVQLVGLALEISDDHARDAAKSLDEAERAVQNGPRLDALSRASEAQTRSLQHIDDLLDELAEWDNFQNILSLTRDILNRQKALRERTQKFASEK